MAKQTNWGKWVDKSDSIRLNINDPRFGHLRTRNVVRCYANLIFHVQISEEHFPCGIVEHLWIGKHTNEPLIWSEGQRIKNELCGSDKTAIEFYPAENVKIDLAPLYHLWILPDGMTLDFGLHLDPNQF